MSDRDYKQELTDMIDRLLTGRWTVEQFRDAYYEFWLEDVPRGVLSDEEEEFFSGVQEQLDWTSSSPTDDEKRHGWLSSDDYLDWVRLQRIRFTS